MNLNLNKNQIADILDKIDFPKKFNVTESDMNIIIDYILIYFNSASNYQRLARQFAEMIMNDSKVDFTGINNKCKGEMHIFMVYKDNTLKSLFGKYLEELFNMKIIDVLQHFDRLNMFNAFDKMYSSSNEVREIYNSHLIANLAQTFYCIEFNIKYNAVSVFTNPAYMRMFTLNSDAITKNISLAEEIEIKIGSFRNDVDTTEEERTKIMNLVRAYNEQSKVIYTFLTSDIVKIKDLCEKIPELDIMIGDIYHSQYAIPIDILRTHVNTSKFTFIKYIIDNHKLFAPKN